MEVQDQLVKLHPEAKEISFKHKFAIEELFKKKIQGNIGIDYFSLMIIDTAKILSIYSSCPALEYNLIDNNLWQYDGIFHPQNHEDGAFFFWDELYSNNFRNTLFSEKQRKFGFLFGFSMVKKSNNMMNVYSFATKSQSHKALYQHGMFQHSCRMTQDENHSAIAY